MKHFMIIIILVAFIGSTSADSLRGRDLVEESNQEPIKSWNCTFDKCTGKCECLQDWQKQKEIGGLCLLKKCWKLNEKKDNRFVRNEYIKTNHHYVLPLIFQIVPIVANFGIGYGIIGRWDLFGLYFGVIMGGCCLLCCCFCSVLYKQSRNEEQEQNTSKSKIVPAGTSKSKPVSKSKKNNDEDLCCTGLFVVIWGISLVVMWIIGLVQFADPNSGLVDQKGCPLSGY